MAADALEPLARPGGAEGCRNLGRETEHRAAGPDGAPGCPGCRRRACLDAFAKVLPTVHSGYARADQPASRALDTGVEEPGERPGNLRDRRRRFSAVRRPLPCTPAP